MNMRERLLNTFKASIKEGMDNSKEMIQNNIVSYETDIGIDKVNPGEFSPGEITDVENLVNKAEMANDTDFNKGEGSGPMGIEDEINSLLNDLVDISAPVEADSIEIVKTTEPKLHENHAPTQDMPSEVNTMEQMVYTVLNESNPIEPTKVKSALNTIIINLTPVREMFIATLDAAAKEGHEGELTMLYKLIEMYEQAAESQENIRIFDILTTELGLPGVSEIIVDVLNGEISKEDGIEGLLYQLAPSTPEYEENIVSESTFSNIVNRILKESNYAGPLDFVPDTRINVSDVLKTLKDEIGDGSEGIHVDQVYDERKNNVYKVSQINKDLLPKKIQVETLILELDGDTYIPNKISEEFPLKK